MAKKKLVVVESPAKAKTINKYLGKNFVVEASVGHIKDLSKFKLGVNIEAGFEPKYVTITGKSTIIKRLRQSAADAEEVLIATDPDREGEAIAWHIAEEIKKDNSNIKRVIFNEITKSGVQKGIANPREIDEEMFMSQQARRVMDRLIGFQVSPFLSRAMLDKTSEALSAGRVQSVALRLICEREEIITEFAPIEYWNIFAEFSFDNAKPFKSKLVSFDITSIKNPEGSATGKDDSETAKIQKKLAELHYIRTAEQANSLLERINAERFKVAEINKSSIKKKPSAPFTTSQLQQEASKKLRFTNKQTMQIAQRLYEGINIGKDGSVGLITYMRTDSVRVSPDAVQAAREYIAKNYGEEYLPKSPNTYSSKSSNVQDAHEAIRPTSLEYSPKEVKAYLSKEEAKLYELIYNRFVASQMSVAQLEQTSINIEGGDFIFRTTGTEIKFKGFLVVYEDSPDLNENGDDKEGSMILPSGLVEGKELNLESTDSKQSFTKAPPRYNEASLVKELDELGIGRPSTYAQIVSTLLDRKYVELISKAFAPTTLGTDVNNVLVSNFPDLFSVKFTAKMEEELDIIAEGKSSYLKTMNEFYEPFKKSLSEAENQSTDITCDVCGKPMTIKISRRGRFLGCTGYPDCTNTKPLPKGTHGGKKEPEIAEGVTCDICGSQMVIRSSRYGKFYGCIRYPECKGIKQIKSEVKCPSCNEGNLIERFSPKSKKKFWGCSNYPNCDYLTNHEPVNQKCQKCGNSYLEIRYKKVGAGYEKYMSCPSCKAQYEVSQD